MSIFKSIKKRLLPAAIGFVTGGPAGAVAGALGAGKLGAKLGSMGGMPRMPGPIKQFPAARGMLPALGAAARVGLPAIARALPGAGAGRRMLPAVGRAVRDVGTVVAGGLLLEATTGQVIGRVRRSKRINPMNVKAMRRAIRRVKSGRKIAQEIERMLPKRKASQACPPAFTRKRKC